MFNNFYNPNNNNNIPIKYNNNSYDLFQNTDYRKNIIFRLASTTAAAAKEDFYNLNRH